MTPLFRGEQHQSSWLAIPLGFSLGALGGAELNEAKVILATEATALGYRLQGLVIQFALLIGLLLADVPLVRKAFTAWIKANSSRTLA